MTVLQQEQMGGLQVLHQNQWVNVRPVVLIINNLDVLQVIAVGSACIVVFHLQPAFVLLRFEG